jgi:hypothetical protein
MRSRLLCGLALAALIDLAAVSGCGGPDLVVGSPFPPASVTPASGTPTPGTGCGTPGTGCFLSTDCCSGLCNPTFNTCQ